ncbi:sugar phosphate nucleotidyltransferase [Kitasatospora sp. NPDC048239]|uniref:sugar phosphate nucleotidyltransferase n=1 Tax=Kitasatospora sp. NPDC048239 TaxID=3364046 RepID=UPI003715DA92
MPGLTAVIAAAGVGSRFFPIGKTTPKCMLPVWNRPRLSYTVADCIAAGADRIAVVTAPGECTRQVRHFLTPDPEMERYFAARGWQHKYEPIARPVPAEITVIEQPRDTGHYGTALPPMCAAEWIAGDDFLLVSGDDLLLRLDQGSDLADLVAARRSAGTTGAVAVAARPTGRCATGSSSTAPAPGSTRCWTRCGPGTPTTASAAPPRTSTSAGPCSPPPHCRTSPPSSPPSTANSGPPTP